MWLYENDENSLPLMNVWKALQVVTVSRTY